MIGVINMIILFLIKALNDSVLMTIFFKIICKQKICILQCPKYKSVKEHHFHSLLHHSLLK